MTPGQAGGRARGGAGPPPPAGWRLRAYLAGLAVVFMATALGGGLYITVQASNDAVATAARDAGYAARQATGEIASDIRVAQAQVAGLAATPNVAAAFHGHAGCSLSFAGVGAFTTGHLDLVSASGAVACTSLPAGTTGAPYARASWLTAAIRRPRVAGPVLDPRLHQMVLIVSAPIGRQGTAAAFLGLVGLGPGLAHLYGGPTHLTFLVTDGHLRTVLARAPDPRRWVGRRVARTSFDSRASLLDRSDVNGVATIFAERRVPGRGWLVFAGSDRGAALAAATRLRSTEDLILVGGLLAALCATLLIYRQITGPIQRLSRQVEAAALMAAPTPVAVGGPVEVGSLAVGVNHLIASVGRELAERRRAEDEAHESERAYRELFEANPHPMWIEDAATSQVVEVNHAAVTQYGHTPQEFCALHAEDVRVSDGPGPKPAEAAPLYADLPTHRQRHRRRDGSLIDVEVTTQPVAFAGGPARLVMAVDVTERERGRRQMQQTQRLESLGHLAGGVAHDFNNLLAVILNYAAFVGETASAAAADDGPRWQPVADDVAQIERAATRAAELTRQLLAFARREVVSPRSLDLNEVIREVEPMLRRTLGEHVSLVTTRGDDLRPVEADPGQVEQVLVNLAVNARDAMPRGGTLTIDTANVDIDETYAATRPTLRPGRYVLLRVSDTGQGMPPDVVEHAFEPFFTTKPAGQGTGLGLATVYGIVTQAGGSVRIYSEPGLGTTVTVALPAVARTTPAPPPEKVPPVRSGGRTILVVEDEGAIREVAERILVREGYAVLTAGNGPEALQVSRTHPGPIDLLLTDVVMPQMRGTELAEALRAARPDLRVLYMSGYAPPAFGTNGMLASGDALVEKPFSRVSLLGRVAAALERA